MLLTIEPHGQWPSAARTDHRCPALAIRQYAIAAIGGPGPLRTWADRFSILSGPNRPGLLLAVHGTDPLAVPDSRW